MKMVNLRDRAERESFAKEAASYFKSHAEKTSYTAGEISAGELFALRFGLGNDCVVIFRIDEYQDVENYQNIIDMNG